MSGDTRLDAIFAALADPTRRAILSALLEDDMAVSDVAAGFEVTLAAISRHLGILAAAGLIRQERRGRITWCQLDPEAMREAAVWMRGFGQLDPLDLDAFERFLAVELAEDADLAEGAAAEAATDAPTDASNTNPENFTHVSKGPDM